MTWSDYYRFGRTGDPWREFERMRQVLNNLTTPPSTGEFPAVNVWISSDEALVSTEIPGIEPKDVDIAVTGKVLTIRGSRPPEEEREGESYHRRERWSGSFSRAIDLPFAADANKVEARFSTGVLSITLPRAESDKPRKITVKSE